MFDVLRIFHVLASAINNFYDTIGEGSTLGGTQLDEVGGRDMMDMETEITRSCLFNINLAFFVAGLAPFFCQKILLLYQQFCQH